MVRASRSPRGNRNSGRGSPPPAWIACSCRRKLLPDRGVAEPGEPRMGHGVVAQPVAARDDRGDSRRVGRGPVAGQEERAAHAFGGQRLQDAWQPRRVGAGVERQGHHRSGPRNHFEVAAGQRGGKRRGRRSGAGGFGAGTAGGGAGAGAAGTVALAVGAGASDGGGERRGTGRRHRRRTRSGRGRSRTVSGRRRGCRPRCGWHRREDDRQHHRGGQQQHGERNREPSASLAPEDRPHDSLWRRRSAAGARAERPARPAARRESGGRPGTGRTS